MRSFVIVEPDSFTDSLSNLIEIAEAPIQTIFEFDNAVHPFSQGIIITVACGPHTGTTASLAQPVSIAVGGELNPAVTVMDERTTSDRSLSQSLFQGTQRTISGQAITDMMTDNEAGIGIGDQGQISEAVFDVDISDIADVSLVGIVWARSATCGLATA